MSRTIRLLSVPLLLFAVMNMTTIAQEKDNAPVAEIVPGQKLHNVSKIEPRTAEFVSFISNKGKRSFSSLLSRKVEFDEVEGRKVIRIQQTYHLAGGSTVDTSIVDRDTLVPISYRSQLEKGGESFDFSPGRAQGTIVAEDGSTKSIDVKFDDPVFNIVILETVIQSLPLRERYKARLNAYNPGRQSFNIVLSVIGTESILGADGKHIEAWVVTMDGAAAPTTIWIDKKTGTSIRQKTLLRGGAEFWQVRLY